MSEPEKQQIGDGSDDYGHGVTQMAKAAKQAGQEAAKQAASKGLEGTANAAAAVVQVGAEGGKAVAKIAAGTAMGGPLGAVLSAAWSMRHTLFKILVSICLLLLFLIVMVVSLPSIVSNSVFGMDGVQPAEGATLESAYAEMADAVSRVVNGGYDLSLAKVEQLIADGGYDYELSMEAVVNHARGSAEYDVCYILAAYSASLEQQDTNKDDMIAKLNHVAGSMFPVTSKEMEKEIVIPVSYYTYKPVTITVVTKKIQNGTKKEAPQYRYKTASKTYYLPDESHSSNTAVTVDAYKAVNVTIPAYSEGSITGTTIGSYYEPNGQETLTPGMEIIKYLECTIHPFDNAVITDAFGIDLNATYGKFKITYGEAIQNMADALKRTLYSAVSSGNVVPLTDADLILFVNAQNCNATRKYILSTALSLVGKVPYFWGGKSGPGWNDEWNTPKLVAAAGSSTTGTIRPYGLDCSGFTTWIYMTSLGVDIGAGTSGQYPNTTAIAASELLPGDLAFHGDSGGGWSHVLMFAGYGENGQHMWVHSSGGDGVIFNTPSYEGSLVLRRPSNVDFNAPVSNDKDMTGTPISTLEVDVTHYCACSKCCGSNATGTTASGKRVSNGMVAMSSHYPFGTQIMINGTLYTVEDRGGSGIENDIHRVDIYVPDHNQALRMGRYKTTATIYRIGR